MQQSTGADVLSLPFFYSLRSLLQDVSAGQHKFAWVRPRRAPSQEMAMVVFRETMRRTLERVCASVIIASMSDRGLDALGIPAWESDLGIGLYSIPLN